MTNEELLNPTDARVFRITHIDNVPWVLDHGIGCATHETQQDDFTPIGHAELIGKRATREVPVEPGGTLSDYVPFYFTPWSPMLYNIKTGYGSGVIQRPMREIVIFVARLRELHRRGHPVRFTDGHAFMDQTRFFRDPSDLDQIDWSILQRRDFARDLDDLDKTRRYQAEALVREHVPLDNIRGIVCNTRSAKERVLREAHQRQLEISVKCLPNWYF